MKNMILETKSVTKKYKNTLAVDQFNMTIFEGDIYGLIGRNGAGKTTLIRMITALSIPDAGSIALFGSDDQASLKINRKRIGSVIETPAFYPKLSAFKNLEYYRRLKGIPNKNSIDEVLKMVGLTDTGKKKFKDFSMGMKQRLGLALALLDKPDFIILDEPINGLDPFGIIEFRKTIQNLNKTYAITFLISSHLLSELAMVANRYGIINNGKLVKEIDHVMVEEACKTGLSIKVNDVAKAAYVIETSLNTKNYKVINDVEIRLYDHLDNPSFVIACLSQEGIQVSSLHEVGDNLEDYFVSLVGEVKSC